MNHEVTLCPFKANINSLVDEILRQDLAQMLKKQNIRYKYLWRQDFIPVLLKRFSSNFEHVICIFGENAGI